MIRLEAGLSTARYCRLLDVPERSYRRWQQRQRQGRPVKGPWPAPQRDRVEPDAVAYADRFPAWGHRKVAGLLRVDGHQAADSTVLRALRRSGRQQPVDYQAERRQHAAARRAAFVVPPSGPNQVWQLDFSEFETRMGGVWRIGGVADYWSKVELGWHVSTTANHRDAIETVEQAIAEAERLAGRPLVELLADPASGEIRPIALVTDNGPCFKSVRFTAYIDRRPTSAPPQKLSRMEMRVLFLLSAGETVRGVATIIGRSPRTVETHVEAIKRKLNARNCAAMVAIACDRGILPPGSLVRAEAVIAARSAQPEEPEPQSMTSPMQA